MLWRPDGDVAPDTYRAFRAPLRLAGAATLALDVAGASWFGVWVDERLIAHGPARFPAGRPTADRHELRLDAGDHVVAILLHHVGADTRLLLATPPWLRVDAAIDGARRPLAWRTSETRGYARARRRINPELGWSEWRDTRAGDDEWRAPAFDDGPWTAIADAELPPLPASDAPPPRLTAIAPELVGEGALAERFGYEADDPPLRFLLRDLAPRAVPAQGVWRRYDLGRVRLGVPRVVLDAPPGAVVELGCAEALADGRVAPVITLSLGPSCNLDHVVARGGRQEFLPLTPKGGRWLEIHVLADPALVRFVAVEWLDRGQHGAPDGSFACGDPLLERIWSVGVDTYRACAEDAIVDNPTRERGAWLGDAVVALPIAAAAYGDLRLVRRALAMAAACARDDGVVAGLYPGQPAFTATYALHWFVAVRDLWRLTGDTALLAELMPAAQRTFATYAALIGREPAAFGWCFVDWGYAADGDVDVAVHLHLVAAARAFADWARAIGRADVADGALAAAARAGAVVTRALAATARAGAVDWPRAGYHVAALALAHGFVAQTERGACIAAIATHLARCFPNDPSAPRLTDPGVADRRLITPYFAHHAFPALFAHGAADLALAQIRHCWGWWLAQGGTTWMEVFDPRWSHCHQWSGAPTWLLSRYVLGLEPRQDLGPATFVFAPIPGSLAQAEGRVPIPGSDDIVSVAWRRVGDELIARIAAPRPITVRTADGAATRVDGDARIAVPAG